MDYDCEDLEAAAQRSSAARPRSDGCEECLASGSDWVHLRLCLTCGHLGCCDSSPNRHASTHAKAHHHPVIRSYEPGERWAYCYEHDTYAELPLEPEALAPQHFAAP